MPSTSMSRSRQLEDLQARSMPSRRFTPRRSTGRAHRSRQLEPERLDGRSIDRLGAMAKPDELPIVQEAARPKPMPDESSGSSPWSTSLQLDELRIVAAAVDARGSSRRERKSLSTADSSRRGRNRIDLEKGPVNLQR